MMPWESALCWFLAIYGTACLLIAIDTSRRTKRLLAQVREQADLLDETLGRAPR